MRDSKIIDINWNVVLILDKKVTFKIDDCPFTANISLKPEIIISRTIKSITNTGLAL